MDEALWINCVNGSVPPSIAYIRWTIGESSFWHRNASPHNSSFLRIGGKFEVSLLRRQNGGRTEAERTQSEGKTKGDPLVTYGDMTAKAGLLDFYTSNSWEASRRFTLNFGVNAQAFMLNGDWSVEPRVSCQWRTSEHGTLSFGYGLNSQVEKLDVYFVEKDGKNVNHDLNMTRAHHMQMSYLHMLNADLALRAEVYYQRMFDMPIAEEGTFAVVNRNEYYIDSKLVSKGLGRNYGIALSLEQYLHKGSSGW